MRIRDLYWACDSINPDDEFFVYFDSEDYVFQSMDTEFQGTYQEMDIDTHNLEVVNFKIDHVNDFIYVLVGEE